jgi:hypothetical protein
LCPLAATTFQDAPAMMISMTADEKRDSLNRWRKRLKEIGTKARKAREKVAGGFGKLAEKLGGSGG